MFERGFQTGGREGIIQGMWPVQRVESITSLLALRKIQAYEQKALLAYNKFMWCFHKAKLVMCLPYKHTKNLWVENIFPATPGPTFI